MGSEALSFLLVLFLAASVAFRNGLLFVCALLLLLTWTAIWLWRRYGLRNVEFRREFSQRRAFFGEEVELVTEVVNRKILPLPWLETSDEIPKGLAPIRGRVTPSHKTDRTLLTNVLSLGWYEQVRRHYRVQCTERGLHTFGPVKLAAGDIFGFSRQETSLGHEDHLLVYPKVVPMAKLGLPAKQPFGNLKARQWILQDPLRTVGAREYQSGDSPRYIDWKATARAQQLQVKVFEPATTYHLLLFLNLNTYGNAWWWLGYDANLLELAVCTAASVANWGWEQGYHVGLYVNGRSRISEDKIAVPSGRSPDQLTKILESLAKVQPFATMPLEALLLAQARDIHFGATIVIVTATLNAEIYAEIASLRSAGNQIALLLIGEGTEFVEIRGVSIFRIGGEEKWREMVEIGAEGQG